VGRGGQIIRVAKLRNHVRRRRCPA
jgi:hypothetical protein